MGLFEVVPKPNVELSKDIVHYLHMCVCPYTAWVGEHFDVMLSIQMLMERQVHFLPFFDYPPFFTENELITL